MTTIAAENITPILASLESGGGPEAIARARQAGLKAVGYCCPYVPVELILAHRMLPVRLDPADVAGIAACACASPQPEKASPAPVVEALDGLIVTAVGNGKKQDSEPADVSGLPVVTLHLPSCHDRYRVSPGPERDYKAGLKSLSLSLSRISGRRPGYLDMMRSILLEKRIRHNLRGLYEAPLSENTPLGWRALERLSRAGAGTGRPGYYQGLERLKAELAASAPALAGDQSRLMLYGPALDGRADEVLDLIELSGGLIVTDYICTASARLRKTVPVWGTFERPAESLAELYLFNAPCPFMGGHEARLMRMLALARWYRVHALVCVNPGSNPVFKSDFERLSEDFYSRLFIPSLYIEDSLPLKDPQGLRERLNDFIDIIGGRV